jgi:hypothetical protein
VKQAASRDDLARCIEQSFGIPNSIIGEALDSIRTLARA